MSVRYRGPGRLVRPLLVALVAAACALAGTPGAAQPLPDFRRCATMEFYPDLLPGAYRAGAEVLRQDAAAVRAQLDQFREGDEQVYVIPVVIHIVHHVTDFAPGMGSNITDGQALSQIQVLNEDFRALLGTPGQSSYPDSIAADTRVEFVLATEDPDGNPTTGIVRHPRADYVPGVGYDPALGFPGQFDLLVKPETIWDPERYMNMWSADLGPLLLGYAQFPEGSGLAGMPSTPQDPLTDGVVMNYSAFGSSEIYPGGNYNPPYDTGRTTTHEVGHFLGLRHIWGDGTGDACPLDDFVHDTPRAGGSNGGCPNVNSCAPREGDLDFGGVDMRDMVENYMDYTHDRCMNTFTEGQKARIRHVLEVSPRRASLVGNDPDRRGLVVEKHDGGAPVRDGDVLTYTLTVTNDAAAPATGVVLTDEVPEGTVYVAGSASGGGAEAGGTVTWPLGTLGPGEALTRTFQVRVATGEGSEFLFQDGMEAGGGHWTVGGLLPTWAITTADAHRGARSWFAEDPDHDSDQWLTLAASEPLPEGALFRFWHRYNTEAGYDGAVVELSTNGGLTWQDAGPYFVRNGYNGTIALGDNLYIGGREVFHGSSGGFVETVADLGDFAGQAVTVRFRLASDVMVGAEGWFVDDVAFATRLVSVTGTARVASAEGVQAEAPLATDVLPALAVVRAFLEGPYDAASGAMTTDLRADGHLPLSQPYGGAPWAYAGPEVVAAAPEGVVDWVLLELRTGDPGAGMTVAARRAAFLAADGRVVDLDGEGAPAFEGAEDGAYWLVLHHRNHLAVMSAAPVAVRDGRAAADLTSPAGVYGGAGAAKAVAPGVLALTAADGDGSGVVDRDDRAVWLSDNGRSGYLRGDYDLSGKVNGQDQNRLWRPNEGARSAVPPAVGGLARTQPARSR